MTQANRKSTSTVKKSPKAKAPAVKHVKITHKQGTIAIVIALVLLNILLFSTVKQIQSLESQQNSIIPIGQHQTYHDVTIEATGIKTETGYIMGIEPSEDEKIISVQLTITNESDTDFEFYPTAQTFVRDNQGSQFIMVPVELPLPFVATTIKPGETKTGQVSYLVTNRAVPLFLYVESRQSGAGPFVFKLQ